MKFNDPTSHPIDKMVLAAKLALYARIERSSALDRHKLGLGMDETQVTKALRRCMDESPLYPSCIRVIGTEFRDMYDDHPGLAYFTVDTVREFSLPAYCSMKIARAKAIAIYQELKVSQCCEYADHDPVEGDFSPLRFVILDQFNRTLDEVSALHLADDSEKYWESFHLQGIEVDRIAAEAEATERAAAEEARWDNIDTANGLRNAASRLRRLISIVDLQGRLIH